LCFIKNLEKTSVYKKLVQYSNDFTSSNNIFELDQHLLPNNTSQTSDISYIVVKIFSVIRKLMIILNFFV
ncbi:hypothetical protein, partial [Vibrio parahaemolyticus]|uniref:hypothetical protein n=4 Tax=Gammaproteobacteria TaxID=1236 RepID=UPI001C6055FA